jgi:hypothetical protein
MLWLILLFTSHKYKLLIVIKIKKTHFYFQDNYFILNNIANSVIIFDSLILIY